MTNMIDAAAKLAELHAKREVERKAFEAARNAYNEAEWAVGGHHPLDPAP